MTALLVPSEVFNRRSAQIAFSIFLSQPCGDVIAARVCAQNLLGVAYHTQPFAKEALLLLTAACLHVGAMAEAEPTLSQVKALLLSSQLVAQFRASSSAFLQFVAADMADTGPLAMRGALALALAATADGTALIRP